MAERGRVASNLLHWGWRQWLAVIAALLAVTLAPLGWIQWQQLRLLNDLAVNQFDSIQWHSYQLERELSRLEQAISLAQIEPA
jgi:hypothetical protein